jgi:hypothetical protein
MTKKDYEMLAEFMRFTAPESWDSEDTKQQWVMMLNVLSNKLVGTNPRFDYARFRRACYGETE